MSTRPNRMSILRPIRGIYFGWQFRRDVYLCVMKFDKSSTAAFSGHRTFKMAAAADLFSGAHDNTPETIAERVRRAVAALYAEGYRDFLCGMAEGFDLLAGETVAAMRADHPAMRLIAVVPFMGQAAGFGSELRARYDDLLERADHVVVVSPTYSPDSFHRRNDFLVDNSTALICYYNGSKGGTAYTVRRALKAGVRVLNVSE